jgi:hypothetical protein
MSQIDQQVVKNVATAACDLLQKATIEGKDVPVYGDVWNFLNALIGGDLSVVQTAELQGLVESDKEIAIMQEVINRYPKVVGQKVDAVRLEMTENQPPRPTPTPKPPKSKK